jgi:hypothetical protein
MKRKTPAKAVPQRRRVDLDDLIEQITVDAYGDAEQLWAFRQAFEDEIPIAVFRIRYRRTCNGAPVRLRWQRASGADR